MMAMEDAVLVGVTSSPETRVAVEWALHEAEKRRCPIWFAHVFAKPTIADPSIEVLYRRIAVRDSEKFLRDLEAEASKRGIASRIIMLSGHAHEVLVKLSHEASLTVVGRRPHSKLTSRLGSTSSALAAHSQSPTAVIPHDWHPPTPHKPRKMDRARVLDRSW